MENQIDSMVNLTENAVQELKRLMTAEGFDHTKQLRIGVKGGGCSGLSYILDFDIPQSEDEHFLIEGIPCIMNPAHGLYLMGMQIDWSTGLEARGFVFTNPNASKTCGCGSSFSV
ncbi:MAG: HesB/IscA family protein [Chitinophagaceae bacterium]